MKINKKDALALAKVLHQHVDHLHSCLASGESKSKHQDTLEDLAARVDEFLVCGDVDDDVCEHDCCVDEGEADDDEGDEDLGEEEEDAGEEDEENDEESDEDKESSEEDDGDDPEVEEEDELDPVSFVYGSELHDLKPAKADEGSVEFELVEDANLDDGEEGDRVDLLVDSYLKIEGVCHIRRKGKELHVHDSEGNWHVFNVSRFPKGWSDALPLDDLVEVEA